MSDDAKLIADTLAAGFTSLNKELEGLKKELDEREKLDRRIFRVVALFVIITLPIGAKQLMDLADTMSGQMQAMNKNMDAMNANMLSMKEDMGAMQVSMSTMDGNMANMTAYINAMTGHVSMMDQGMRVMNGSMVDMDRSMKPMRAMGSMIPGW